MRHASGRRRCQSARGPHRGGQSEGARARLIYISRALERDASTDPIRTDGRRENCSGTVDCRQRQSTRLDMTDRVHLVLCHRAAPTVGFVATVRAQRDDGRLGAFTTPSQTRGGTSLSTSGRSHGLATNPSLCVSVSRLAYDERRWVITTDETVRIERVNITIN